MKTMTRSVTLNTSGEAILRVDWLRHVNVRGTASEGMATKHNRKDGSR
ncbi:MAG: hypothetical protein AAF514_06855 [Verrucomicrobiota bacterium]